MNENIFDKLDFGPFRSLLDNDDITDISYDNNGQIWIRSLTQGSMRVEVEGATPEFVEKLAFQCSNVMGTTFNNAKPFLDAESAELRMNFVHHSIATNGIALVIRKTPAKIRLEKEKLIKEDYFTPAIHDLLVKCVEAHCNIIVAGETGSGKTEFVKYLASHTLTNEKIITIEDTLELHLDKIFPQRDIVAMKTNNVASYTDVLVTCMRQNPKWILLSEVRSAEAVSAVRNSISSGHNILSTIHADKASAIPYRLYSLMETDLDVHQFLSTIYRYIQLGVHIRAFYSKEYGQFHREVDEVTEFFVDENNEPVSRTIYQKKFGKIMMCKPSKHLIEYIVNQNVDIDDIINDLPDELPLTEMEDESCDNNDSSQESNTSGEENSLNVNSNEIAQNSSVSDENIVKPSIDPNEGMPGAKPDENLVIVPGAELGHEESIPSMSDDGNVPLLTPVVSSFGDLLSNNSSDLSNGVVDPNAQIINGGQSIIDDENNALVGGVSAIQGTIPVDGQVTPTEVPPVQGAEVLGETVPTVQSTMPVDGQVAPGEVPVQGTEVLAETVPKVQSTMPVDGQVVLGEVPVQGTDLGGAIPTVQSTMPVDGQVAPGEVLAQEADLGGAIPTVQSTMPVDGQVAPGEVPVQGTDLGGAIPTVQSTMPVDGQVVLGEVPVQGIDLGGAIPTVQSTMPVDGQIVSGEVPVQGTDLGGAIPTVQSTMPVDGQVAPGEVPVQGTDLGGAIPTVQSTMPVDGQVAPGKVPVQGSEVLGGANTAVSNLAPTDEVVSIPVLQDSSSPLAASSIPATGGPVIPNIVKLDQ